MEKQPSSLPLWSPPALDLSLDSFSTDILSQFGKNEPENTINVNHTQVLDSSESLELSPVDQSRSTICESQMSCSLDRGETPSLMEEEESMIDSKRDSTILKAESIRRDSVEITEDSVISVDSNNISCPLSTNPVQDELEIEHSVDIVETDQQSMISSIVSEPKKDDHITVQVDNESSVSCVETKSVKEQVNEKKGPESLSTPERSVCTNTQPKRRSIFFFRFC